MSVSSTRGGKLQRPGPSKAPLPRLPSFDIFLSNFSPIVTTGKKKVSDEIPQQNILSSHTNSTQHSGNSKGQLQQEVKSEAKIIDAKYHFEGEASAAADDLPRNKLSPPIKDHFTEKKQTVQSVASHSETSHAPFQSKTVFSESTHKTSQDKLNITRMLPFRKGLVQSTDSKEQILNKNDAPTTRNSFAKHCNVTTSRTTQTLNDDKLFSTGTKQFHDKGTMTDKGSMYLSSSVPALPNNPSSSSQNSTTKVLVEDTIASNQLAMNTSDIKAMSNHSSESWTDHFKSLSRIDKFVYFEHFLGELTEDTQEMLLDIFKKAPVFYSMDDIKDSVSANANNSKKPRSRGRSRSGSLSSASSQEESPKRRRAESSGSTSAELYGDELEEDAYDLDEETLAILEKYSGDIEKLRSEIRYLQGSHHGMQSNTESDDSESCDDQLNDYYLKNDDMDDSEEEDDESLPDYDPNANANLRDIIAQKQYIGLPPHSHNSNESLLAQMLTFCETDFIAFVSNVLPQELGTLQCFLWYDNQTSEVQLFLDGSEPTLLMGATCKKLKRKGFEFVISTPEWNGSNKVCKLVKVQSAHVSHYNIFDMQDKTNDIVKGVSPIQQQSYVPASGVGGGLYSRVAAIQQEHKSPTSSQNDRALSSRGGPVQLGAIQIKSIDSKPRELLLLMPKIEVTSNSLTGQTAYFQEKIWDSENPNEQMLQVALSGERDQLNIIHNREATFNEDTNSYTMDFGERVSYASSKNLILQEFNSDGSTKLLTGKMGRLQFAVDFAFPLSPVVAFATCIANLVTQTGRKKKRRKL